MKDLVDNSALLVKGLIKNSTPSIKTKRREEKPPKPPTHAFIYSEWLAMLDDDDQENIPFQGSKNCGNEVINQPIDATGDEDNQGLEILKNMLLSRNIDPVLRKSYKLSMITLTLIQLV